MIYIIFSLLVKHSITTAKEKISAWNIRKANLERECDRYYGFNQHLWSNSSFTFIPHLWRPCAWRERMAVTEAWEPCAAMTWRWVQKLSKITKGKWLRSFRVGFLILGIIWISDRKAFRQKNPSVIFHFWRI